MSFNVGKLAAYLTLDSSGFDKGIDNAGKRFTGLTTSVKGGAQTIATALTATAAGMTAIGVNAIKTGAQYNILQQNSRAALQTVLGSQKAVNEQMEKLNALASKSPFSKSVFISAQQQLLAFGMDAKKVIPVLDAVQNAVAATGGSSQKLGEITYVLAQIQAAGKITAVDLMQLGQRGIDAATLIGSQMGKTGSEIRRDITNGTLSASDALDALTKGMQAKFGGTTDNIKQQWTGATDRIHAAWRDTGAILARPFIDPNGGGKAVEWANLVADNMRQVQKKVQDVSDIAERRFAPAFEKVTNWLRKGTEAIARFDVSAVDRGLGKLTKYTPVIAGLGGAIVSLGLKGIPVLGGFSAVLNPATAGILSLAATSPKVRAIGSAFMDGFGPAIPMATQLTQAFADLVLNGIDRLSPALARAAHGGGEFLGAMAQLGPELVELVKAGLPLVEVVANLGADFLNLPAPVLAAVTAVVALHKPLGALKTGILDTVQTVVKFVNVQQAMAANQGIPVAMAAGQTAVTGLKTALLGLISPAGLVGIGLTALTAIVAAFVAAKMKAKQRVQEFASTLDAETGAITENTRATVAKKLEEEGLLEAYEKLGGKSSDYVGAILGEKDAVERYNEVMNRSKAKRKANADTIQYGARVSGEAVVAMRKEARESVAVENGYDELKTAVDSAIKSKQREVDASEKSIDANERHAKAIEALMDIQRKQAAANGDLIAAQYATQDATKALTEAISASMGVMRDQNGQIDTASEANRGFIMATKDKIEAINAEMDALTATGASQEALNQRQQELTNGLYEQLAALGITGKEAEEFAKKLGLIPDHKSTVIDMTVDDEAAKQDIDALIDKVTSKTDGVLTIYGDDTPAFETLMNSLGLVETSEGVYSINAKDDPAIAQLLVSLGMVDTSTGTITIDGNNAKVTDAANQAQATINTKTGTITINGKDYATSAASQAVSKINSFQATIGVWFKQKNSVNVPYADGFHKRDGGLVHYYAGGGFSENHVAQIAPAGAWRVWAEPETGGEAYIPLALSKRRRSEQILAEVAHQFGGRFIPMGAQGFANGSLAGASNTPVIHLTAIVTNPFTGEQVKATVQDETIRILAER